MSAGFASPVAPLDFLRRHAPFDELAEAALARLESALEIRFAAAGDRILTRGGAPSDALYVVRKGRVRLEREGETLEVLEAGECFGFPSLLGGRPPLRDALAETDTLLFRFPAPAFRALLAEPGAARFFLDTLTSRLRVVAADPSTAGSLAPARALGRRPVACVTPETTVEAVARAMRERGVGSLLVLRPGFEPEASPPVDAILGIVTDRDLRDRVLAAGRPSATPVEEIATRGLVTLPVGASSVDALALLAHRGIRHLPLVDGERVVGFVSAGDLARERVLHPLALRREIERSPLGELLPGFTGRLRRAVAELSAAGVEASRIGPIVAALTGGLAARLVAEAGAAEGIDGGALAWIVHGSEGRREQILPTDQDNALVIAEGASGDAEVARRAARLAERVVGQLLEAGYPPCPGGYMATRWCDSLPAWSARFDDWIESARPEDAVDFHTFLDFRPVAGALDLEPLRSRRRAAGESPHFLRALARDIAGWKLPVGLFGTLREGDEGFDLKRGSLLVVAIARLAALEAGSEETGTLERLASAGELLGDDASTLAEAFRYLGALRLELALDPARRAESDSGHRIHLASLNALERRFLKEIFGHLQGTRDGLVARFAL
jgi:CBS domain-containing protein